MDIDGDGGAVEESSRKVQVRFVTKLKPPYKTPASSISIPAELTRFGLSSLVNNLLKSGYLPFLFFYYLLLKLREI